MELYAVINMEDKKVIGIYTTEEIAKGVAYHERFTADRFGYGLTVTREIKVVKIDATELN